MTLLKNVFLFSLGLGLGALALAATQNRPRREKPFTERTALPLDRVDSSSEDSFPASDPPSWNATSDLH